MPKNRRTNKLVQKQIRQIETRLMRINLMVDDYLYKQKPISQRSAEACIREISSYKDQCHRDVRSLQVIEKLIRVMKGIIYEQQELQNITEDVNPSQDNNILVPNGMISPVYSLVDEDMTQYLETDNTPPVELDTGREIIHKKINDPINIENEEPKVNGNEIGLSYNLLQNVEYNKNMESDVIDLCDDETDDILDQNFGLDLECEFNKDIQRAISNLSIRDIEADTTPPFSQECSQSILDDQPTYSSSYSRPIDVLFPRPEDLDDVLKSATSTQQKPATEMVIQKKITKITLPFDNVQDYATKALCHARNETAEPKASTEIAFNDITTKIKLPTTKQNIQIPVNRPVNKIKSSMVNNATKRMQNAKKTNSRTKKPQINNKAQIDISKKIDNRLVKISKNARIKPAGKPNVKASEASAQSKTQPTQSINILTYHDSKLEGQKKYYIKNDKRKEATCNTTVEEDLSWIENIRFVREIQSDEYEALTVSDTFWEDCTLPSNWMEEDFNY